MISSEALSRHVELLFGDEATQGLLVQEVQGELYGVTEDAVLEGAVKRGVGCLLYFGYFAAGGHQVVRVAAEELAIDQSVLLRPVGQFLPGFGADWVEDFFFLETEVLLPQFQPQLVGQLRDQGRLAVQDPFHKIFPSHHHRDLRVPIACQAAIIDVGRPTKHHLIIDYHQLRVKINNLSDWLTHCVESPVIPQSEELNVLAGIIGVIEQPMPQTSLSPANGVILPLHLPPQQQTFLILQIPSKARHQRQHHIDPKHLTLLNSLNDPQVNSINDFIFDSVWVSGGRDEELILDVDVALGLGDELQVGNVDAELSVALVAAYRPVAHRTHDLALIVPLLYAIAVVVAFVNLGIQVLLLI